MKNINHTVLLFIVLTINANVAFCSEISMNDYGLITKIDGIDIAFSKVGVLKYDYTLMENESKNVNEYLRLNNKYENSRNYIIVGAKKIGDCILITCGQEKVVDGGIDIVYSTISKKIIGKYCAGYRG